MFESAQKPLTLLSSYDALKKERWKMSPSWLEAIREEGRTMFERMGLPTRRHEEWKYTDVSALGQQKFSVSMPMHSPGSALKEKNLSLRLLSESVSPLRMVFVDGFYSPVLSRPGRFPEGVEVGSLAEALKDDHRLVQEHLAAYSRPADNSFIALNNAYIEDGAWVYIPSGVQLSVPVHLVYYSTGRSGPASSHPRNLIVTGKGSVVTVIEEYIGDAGAVYFTNPVTEIVVDDEAEVEHYKIQRESIDAFHIAAVEVQQGERSRFVSHNISFGGRLTRNNIHSYINAPGSFCTFNGLFMIRGDQHVDNHTLIRHRAPDCLSSEVYHGILDDRARGVFNGKIYVERGAQGTDSKQTNRSLMLSGDAVIDAKPQLEIYADDVKCTHGATVGQIDKDSLYYMRSRGISVDEARRMLTRGFARQITDRMTLDTLREGLEQELTNQF
jgi:Fe-S cluster assembly protein SufD